MCLRHLNMGALGICVAALALTAVGPVRAEQQNGSAAQNSYAPAATPATRLQVTGSGARLSVDAERADVQSLLRAVLKQAGRQFVPDPNVTGQVTLLLTDQPLDAVLRAICTASYLKYTEAPSGLYQFVRDDAAVSRAFAQLARLNAQSLTQLRALGLDVPMGEQLAEGKTRSQGVRGTGAPLSAADAPAQGAFAAKPAPAGGPAASSRALNSGGGTRGLKTYRDGQGREISAPGANIHAYVLPQANNVLALRNRTSPPELQTNNVLTRPNGFVWFNIPEEKPEPVAAVLQRFSQQANVPILVDQSIPNSLKFRLWGSLSPRQLPEALNVLAPTAHLQWRWIGDSIFVVPAPSFQVSFGDQGATRSAYPAQQRAEQSAGGDSKLGRGGSE